MLQSILFLCLVLVLTASPALSSSSYAAICDSAFCRILDSASSEINALKTTIIAGKPVVNLGKKADEICNSALERFAAEAPIPDNSPESEALYDKKVEDLEQLLDAPLHVLYLKQLSLVRDKSLKVFKQALTAGEGSEFEALMQADEVFRKDAEDATRASPEWTYSKELAGMKAALVEIANRSRKVVEAKVQASKQNQQAMQYLQMQQQQLQAIQQQVSGQSSPWNIGMAYRIPDTNINLSGSYQQGKGTIQVSCVPDESLPLLGPNGFVHGVTPGNVGISFNINI